MESIESLRNKATEYLWHPYTDINSFEKTEFPIIESAEGVYIKEHGGKKLLDGIASWWCVNFGHSHPELVDAITAQSKKLQHSILGGISHENAINLSEKLSQITPNGLKYSYFAGDGASATEAALKIALQYWCNKGITNRTKFICLEDGYHGDTLGAVGVGYVETFHKNYKSVINQSYRACSPHCAECPYDKYHDTCNVECFASMKSLIEKYHNETAAVIVEPLCQGAAGIRIYRKEYLQKLRVLCDEYGLLLIADEIAVGFARTGYMFACDCAGISPDMMLIGKGLTGGYLPMSAVMVSESIYNSFRSDKDNDRTFYHGHTYCGNPITSALALKALDLYEKEDIINLIKPRIKQLKAGIRKLKEYLPNSSVLSLGMIGVVEIRDLDGGAETAKQIAVSARDQGLFIRPLGKSVYLWPPLVTSELELQKMLDILTNSIKKAKNLS
jgi:adenosylmethionine---8-amino-7-oxononanoate aminotransferase